MTTLRGKLVPDPKRSLDGYRITATIDIPVLGDDGQTTTIAVGTDVAADGGVAVELPERRTGDVRIVASAPDGSRVGAATIAAADVGSPFELSVTTVDPVKVVPSDVPGLGRRERLIGRVLDPQGAGAPAKLLVVVWGVPHDGDAQDAVPLLVAETAAGGYFGDDLPPDELDEAWAKVAGGAPVPILLDGGRLPRTVVIVTPVEPPDDDDEDGCGCHAAPPRSPDQADLAANPAAFAADPGRCVDLTVPNRALEEVTFHAVVRTTQPEIRGLQMPNADDVPGPVVDRLVQLVASRPIEAIARLESPITQAAVLTATTTTQLARTALAVRAVPEVGDQSVLEVDEPSVRRSLNLRADVVGELVRNASHLRVDDLLHAERVSTIRTVRDIVHAVGGAPAGRVELGGETQVDWDDTPTLYQATTIAHGHLLTFKQVWRADGYSLGDLLYSCRSPPARRSSSPSSTGIAARSRPARRSAPRPRCSTPRWPTTATSPR